MTIEITPLDTLFFRDGKPFTSGSETWADEIFPPAPSVFYGALRTAYFSKYTDKLNEANTDKDPTKDLRITNIYYKIGNSPYFPIPLDYAYKNKDEKKVILLSLVKNESIYSNCRFNYLLKYHKEKDNYQLESIKSGIINDNDFELYIKSKESSYQINNILELSEICISEPKVGISRSDNTHTYEEHNLYRVGMLRLNKKNSSSTNGFIVSFDGLDINNEGLLKLGGEAKAAQYFTTDDVKIEFPKFKDDDKYFKLVLTTPAIFKNGWLPSFIDNDTLEGILPNTQTKVKLISAVVGKTVNIGGFDMKEGKPKPMKKAVPVGSIYYFEIIQNPNWEIIMNNINGKSISDSIDGYDYNKQGFGIGYIGKLDNFSLEDLK